MAGTCTLFSDQEVVLVRVWASDGHPVVIPATTGAKMALVVLTSGGRRAQF